ncbi:MAG: hypothetical protein A3J76_04100 [Candidatus Moranbacteria bacterium RBG_13_45_13]|nr:MAG: hypothetical protein A3J76_04100 [Candidatus Moranbacteria bacterium RBG_13_45_13]
MIGSNIRKKMIISADDFGKSELANRNTLKLAEEGKLNRVSVMTDGDFSHEELKRLVGTGVKLDIHLHLGNRLEDREKVMESFIKRSIIFLSNYLFGIFSQKRAEKEWENQITEFIKIAGRIPDGINAHRYDHFFPIYFPVAAKLAKKFQIERIRFGKIIQAGKNGLTSGILNFFWKRNRVKILNSDLKSFSFCVNLDWIENFSEFLKNPPPGETELVCHPERKEEFDIIKKYF